MGISKGNREKADLVSHNGKVIGRQGAKEKKTMGEDATIRLDDTICFRMIQGDLEFVKNFLESSSDAAPFLHGVYSELHSKQSAPESGGIGFDQFPYGTTALHIAARGQYPEIVRLLATKGANIDAQDISGYTPLMEAAFWGRLENVQILLDGGANAMLKCIHDGRSKTAQELAENTRSNAWIRRRRVGGPTCESLVNDDTYARDCDRDDIRHLLRGRMFKDPTVPAHLALQGFAFRKDKEVPGLSSFTTYYSFFDKRKAAAVLHRGRNLPDVSAMSGWAHDDESDKPFVSGNEWTAKALSLSQRFNLQLQPSEHDGDKVGRYEASHAEKQLIAYLIDRHWFMEDEMILPDQMDELAESAANLDIQDSDEARSRQRERVRKEKLGKLYEIRPADRLKEAAIMANKPICEECERFIQGVRPSELDLRAHGYRTID
ncbi:Ankyrin-3 [Beauveria bassiana D1-5]|uniref:Ankyrin-3 n=1 Tax=Beauveria bassiana D1-5 TaxID=1245745 RepID=A0A0A2VJ63_BEABA|nr:Ankyrin-3 [Beauveria bassiana D1-5]